MPGHYWPLAGSLKGCALPSALRKGCIGFRAVSRVIASVFIACLLTLPGISAEKNGATTDVPTQFLEKLRERGWHDVALDYLERIEDDPLATREFLADKEYHLAVTRGALARLAVGETERQNLLSQSADGFQKFAKEQPESQHYIAALSQLSNMLAEQALVTLAKADRLPTEGSTEQETLRVSARELLEQAAQAVEKMLSSIESRMDELPRGAALQADKPAAALKQDLLAKQAEGRFLAANLNFEKSRTYRKGSVDYDTALDTAIASFKQLRKQYESKLIGFYAVLYEGRCYQEAGDFEKSLDTYSELVNQPVGQPDFRKLIARAYRHRAECYLAEQNYDKAISESKEWLNESNRDELEQPEWTAVAYQLATAYASKAVADPDDDDAGRLRSDARKLFREVSKRPGEFQDDARAALALSGNSETTSPLEAKNFSEAFEAGKTAIEQMSASQLAVKLAENNNPDGVEELEEQVAANRVQALRYFEQAKKLIDDKSPRDNVIEAQYYLCWLYWESGESEQAANLAEELAGKYPDSQYAPTAARVALAAYQQLYSNAREADSPDATRWSDKVESMAELIVDRWGDSDAATTATNLLISLALRNNDLTEADRLLENLPEKSRGLASLSLGSSLWSLYLQESAKGDEASIDVNQLKSRATKLLTAGYAAVASSSQITAPQAAGVLYYLQALLADGDGEKALEVLENPHVGPLAIVKKNNPQDSEAFALEAYKAALRTYLSLDPPRDDDAVKMMEQLEKIAGDSPESQKKLSGIYVNLSLQLQKQITDLNAQGQSKKARGLASAFTALLDRVAAQSDSQSWQVRNWLAQTSLQLGSGLSGNDADRYYERAEKAYRGILHEVEKNPSFAPNELAILAVRKKLGETLQARGNFALAVEQYEAILKEKPNMLEIQQSTAAALQAWGVNKKDATMLEQAIRGAKPQANAKNLVWGWLQLANVADYAKQKAVLDAKKDPKALETVGKYEEIYFGARLQAAKARLAAAKLAEGEKQQQQLQSLRQSIATLKQLFPELGGKTWLQQFDAVLKEADTLLGGAGK